VTNGAAGGTLYRLADLGARQARYGVCADHYPVVGAAVLETMAEVAGAAWKPEFIIGWARAYQMVAPIMIDGVEQSAAAASRRSPGSRHLHVASDQRLVDVSEGDLRTDHTP
jgi:hemoglobin-like flavoprotein